ncbi:50S ribosomal protein L32e [Candidatus Bathyarchaeota archaeon]|nr:50S ribosomal protein L32e [Candidatus Bathyarchaeota archaeon]NIU81031.1 50S ribosomal protein L32e [Candidatus Bathyarchaeota archaeon]NIV67689.1 50S ribosomal protein L32e [Candidatus Bathyarchaeota archaeon]NIW16674.1 50S ribosomal protein L32e [Candidatus Bathyarchaeota archaeon]NIW34888.1 50S ribosomal protein L32e [Candidatus Bathyarchaeota archaeon]
MKEEREREASEASAMKKRQRLKAKKPDFKRQESWRYKRVKESWRKPRGIDSKMRKKVKGWPKVPNVGYRTPKEARGLHPSGYREVLVRNPDEVRKVDPETEAIRIAHQVGARKRVEISTVAEEMNIHILNPRRAPELEEEFEELTELGEEEAEEASE